MGRLFVFPENWLNVDENHAFSPMISLRGCPSKLVVISPAGSAALNASVIRQDAEPPPPDSCGIVRTMRSSNAPATSAPLPLREQPVTPTRVGSICALGFASRKSMKRLIPQAQAI